MAHCNAILSQLLKMVGRHELEKIASTRHHDQRFRKTSLDAVQRNQGISKLQTLSLRKLYRSYLLHRQGVCRTNVRGMKRHFLPFFGAFSPP